MTRFDYLHRVPPPWIEHLREARTSEHLQAPALVLCAVIVFVAGACAIENHRLQSTLTVQTRLEQRYEQSVRRLQAENISYRRLISILSLARRIRSIASSGSLDAQRFAAIAETLPGHVWLTSVSRDSSGLLLEGRAHDFALVAQVLRSLMHAPGLGNPVLRDAARIEDRLHDGEVKYDLHVDEERS